jgi:WD40 repeat protein/transcriptional regulator with XRE-family HTH domain
MPISIPSTTLEKFTTFGDLLRFLRRRAGITQMELSIAVGYSDTQISRLEQNQRPPDIPTIEARFVSALGLEDEPNVVSRLLDLAANVRREDAPGLGLCPYKGLNYFDEADADLFLGREELTAKLTKRIFSMTSIRHSNQTRFLAIVGASGSGKSSLVRAGLVPALRWDKQSADWHFHVITPTTHPLESLATSLTLETRSVTTTATLIDDLIKDERTLHLFARRKLQSDVNSHLLLVVDQFEEMFSLCRSKDERASFIGTLLRAASEADGPVIVVITLRADFYAHCAKYRQLREALAGNQEYIGAMNSRELRRAIEEPAKQGHWEIEEGLIDMLLHDVGHEPGALPLLSHALMETWERRRARTMTLGGYASSGGVRGAIAETAETVFTDQFTREQQSIARRIFLRLTELGDDTSAVDTRRRANLEELILNPEDAESTRAVLKTLADARLISLDEKTAEVAHEALIREWPALQGWLEENRERLRLQRQLTEAAQEWLEMERTSDLLFRGARLEQFKTWNQKAELALSKLENDFLQASLDHANEQENKKAEQERTRRNLQRSLVVVLSIGLVISAVLAIFAFSAQRQAALSAAEFRSIALASGAQEELDAGFPDRALALALEANNMDNPPPRAQQMLFTAATSTWMRQRFEHSAEIRKVTYSPNGRYLLTTGENRTATLWDIETGEVVKFFEYNTTIWGSAFQPGGDLIAMAGDDGRIILWNPTLDEVNYINVSDAFLIDIIFSADGNRILVGGDDALITLWDVETKNLIRTFEGHTGIIFRLDLDPDGTRFISGSNDNTARIWDLASGETLMIFEMPKDEKLSDERGVFAVRFLPDNQRVVTGDLGGFLYLWDITTGEILREYEGVRASVGAIDVSDDGEFLLMSTTSGDAYINLYNVESGKVLRSYFGHTIGIYGLAFSPDGKTIASASVDGTASIWDLDVPGALYKVDLPASGGGSEIVIHPDSQSFFEVGFDGIIRMREVATGQIIRTFDDNAGRWCLSLVVSPDGRYLVSGDYVTAEPFEDRNAYLWDIQTGELVHTFDQNNGVIFTVAFSPDGGKVAIGETVGKRILMYEVSTGRLLQTFEGHTNWVQNIVFSPDGQKLYSAGRDLTIREWDVETGENLRTFEGHTSRVRGIDISPDGKRLISGSDDFTLKLWDLETGQPIETFIGHDSFVYRTHFSPDGKYILSTGFNLNVILWNAETGDPIWKMQGHSPNSIDIVTGDFTPDGKMIITISEDSEIIAWDISQLPKSYKAWVKENRYIPELTCEQRELYQVEPLCSLEELN